MLANTIIKPPVFPSLPRQKTQEQKALVPVLPSSFDGRKVWNLTKIVNQGDCGACYAITNVTAFNDRINIRFQKQAKKPIEPLSFTYMVNCLHNRELLGCKGGSIWSGAEALVQYPIPYEKDYRTRRICDLPGVKAKTVWTVTHPKMSIKEAVETMKREIFMFGPIVTQVMLYQDFYDTWHTSLTNNVYVRTPNSPQVGGHAFKLVGWGRLKTIPYWVAANSWGSGGYQNSGYVLIRQGTNEIGIELSGSVCCQVGKVEQQVPLNPPWVSVFLILFLVYIVILLFGTQKK